MNELIPLWLSLLFEALTLFLVGYMILITPSRYRSRILLVLSIWLGAQATLGLSGFYQNFSIVPPRMLFMILPPVLFCLYVGLSGKWDAWIKSISWQAITGIQSFRIVMELILWQLFVAGVIPIQMSFEGRNWDILVGLTALPVMWMYSKGYLREKGLLIWNLCGLGLLLNIVVVAITSTPTFLRLFHNEPANRLISVFPFVWLPAFVVAAAMFLHVVSFRKYYLERGLS